MRAANITAAIAVFLWFGLLLLGREGVGGVAGRMGGNVSIVMFDYYVLWPCYVVTGLLGCAWAINVFRRWYLILTLIAAASILALLPFMFFYFGGV